NGANGAFPFTFTVTDANSDTDQGGYTLTVQVPTSTPTIEPTPSGTYTPTNTPITPTNTPTSNPGPIDSVAVYRSGAFYLRYTNTAGSPDLAVSFNLGTKPYPVVGNWTGTGYDTIGVFDQSNGQFLLCTQNDTVACSTAANQIVLVLGSPNDQP